MSTIKSADFLQDYDTYKITAFETTVNIYMQMHETTLSKKDVLVTHYSSGSIGTSMLSSLELLTIYAIIKLYWSQCFLIYSYSNHTNAWVSPIVEENTPGNPYRGEQ